MAPDSAARPVLAARGGARPDGVRAYVSAPVLADEEPDAEPATYVYYPNCSAVRAAGAAPIRAGEPGYARKLDRDGDGVGCE